MTYFCDSGSYLERAQYCLERENPRYLFYAAYELRCFVECRQNEYLDAQKKYRKSLPARWKIGHQSSELRRIFHLDKIQRITNTFPDGFEFVSTYVPVSKALKSNTVRLGKLLHSQNSSLSGEKVSELKSWLDKVRISASECQSGNMLSPVLLDRSTGNSMGEVTLQASAEELQKFKERLHEGALMNAKVEYVKFVSDLS